MNPTLDYATPIQGPPRGGLIAMGVIAIVIGALAGCSALMMPLALVAVRMAPTSAQAQVGLDVPSILMAIGIYALVSTGFIWGGIASIRCRRWVRPLALAIFWPALVIGIMGSVMMVLLLVNMPSQIPVPPGQPAPPPGFMLGAQIFGVLIGAVFYIGLPTTFVVFYRRPFVQKTLDFYNPPPAWTDRCPLPVLGISVWAALMAITTLVLVFRPIIPMFGRYLAGPPAVVFIVLLTLVLLAIAVLSYRIEIAGWWLAVGLVALGSISAVVTFSSAGILEMYRAMNMPPEQLELLTQMPIVRGPALVVLTALSGVITLAYLLYARRFFAMVPPVVPPLVIPPPDAGPAQ